MTRVRVDTNAGGPGWRARKYRRRLRAHIGDGPAVAPIFPNDANCPASASSRAAGRSGQEQLLYICPPFAIYTCGACPCGCRARQTLPPRLRPGKLARVYFGTFRESVNSRDFVARRPRNRLVFQAAAVPRTTKQSNCGTWNRVREVCSKTPKMVRKTSPATTAAGTTRSLKI